MKKKKAAALRLICLLLATTICCVTVFLLSCDKDDTPSSSSEISSESLSAARTKIAAFAKEKKLDPKDYPTELVELLAVNPDAENFVLNYPLLKDSSPVIDLTEHKNSRFVPLFFQWDERWGYREYAGELFGLSGCGPTCLSMVCVFLLGDTRLNPKFIAEFSKSHGYCVDGNGSSWELISKGGRRLGLDVIEIPLDENRMILNLEVGNPIICVMGPGDFTSSGHFIVITDYEDGKFKINDPNSAARSERTWEYSQIKDQIKNLWVCR